MYKGIGASAGIGIGKIVKIKEEELNYTKQSIEDTEAEKKRLSDAIEVFIEKTQKMVESMKVTAGEQEAEILEGHMMPDHVHLLLSIPPKYCVFSFMGYLKGKSAMMIFEKHGNLKYKFGNRHFWATGYYVSTVGLNEATIKKYIREQEKQDMLEDKLTTKEYNDPFKGAGG